ncbi:MAG TPA: hypothetical protein VME24_12925 [Alphaproteobacteria bacterium]|nr:hypothetical protein [Alphaproteobacteria bacterium]
MKIRDSLTGILLFGILAVRAGGANALNYWVASTAQGTGDGTTPLTAASYLNPTFWNGVQSQLAGTNVYVSFETGAYNAGTLSMTNMGNPLHSLTLAAVTAYGPVFSPSANILQLYGCQNFQLNGLVFNGPAQYWGLYCIPNGLNPCRNIAVNNCQFLNLTNAEYAAIGLLNGTRSIQVLNCTFMNVTNGPHEHMIYAPHDIEDVVVSNCVFQDCFADYVRFRDDSEYCVVEDSTFVSTRSSTAWPFVSAELYNETNSDSAGDEFFGTYFQVSSNSFAYDAGGGPGPYSALHFSDTGWSPDTYYCDLTSAQASALNSGSASFQQSFVQTNFGITASGIKMFGNTYSDVTYQMDYQYVTGGTAPYNNWAGTVGLNNVPDSSGTPLGPTPVLRNGNFDRQGFLIAPISPGDDDYECYFRDWFCSPKYTDILWQQGFEGTSNALRFDGTKSQYVYQWISNPSPSWTLDFLFAIGSGFTGTGVKFAADVYHNEITGSGVSVGVNNLGQFGIYNGSTFTVLPALGTFSFSTNAVGSTNYVDPGDTLNVYHLRVVGNYSAATPYVDIYTSDANSLVLDHWSTGNTDWVGSSPLSGQSFPGTVAFYNYTAPVMLDQVSITEGITPVITNAPAITSAYVQGTHFIMTGTNGTAGATFYILSTTNLAVPLANWTRVTTGTFTGSNFAITNVVSPREPVKFYSLELQ